MYMYCTCLQRPFNLLLLFYCFVIFETDFVTQPLVAWYLLCNPGQHFSCLGFLSPEIRGMYSYLASKVLCVFPRLHSTPACFHALKAPACCLKALYLLLPEPKGSFPDQPPLQPNRCSPITLFHIKCFLPAVLGTAQQQCLPQSCEPGFLGYKSALVHSPPFLFHFISYYRKCQPHKSRA